MNLWNNLFPVQSYWKALIFFPLLDPSVSSNFSLWHFSCNDSLLHLWCYHKIFLFPNSYISSSSCVVEVGNGNFESCTHQATYCCRSKSAHCRHIYSDYFTLHYFLISHIPSTIWISFENLSNICSRRRKSTKVWVMMDELTLPDMAFASVSDITVNKVKPRSCFMNRLFCPQNHYEIVVSISLIQKLLVSQQAIRKIFDNI